MLFYILITLFVLLALATPVVYKVCDSDPIFCTSMYAVCGVGFIGGCIILLPALLYYDKVARAAADLHSSHILVEEYTEELYSLEKRLDTKDMSQTMYSVTVNRDTPIKSYVEASLQVKELLLEQKSKIGQACIDISGVRFGVMSGAYTVSNEIVKELYKEHCGRKKLTKEEK